MSVRPEVSLSYVKDELEDADDLIEQHRLELDTSMLGKDDLRFRIRGESDVDGEIYIVEFRCDDYRELPPFVEMIDPETEEAGTKRAYADCFHKEPVICARFNRKTYASYTDTHSDWDLGEWQSEESTDHLGGMINHIFGHIHGHNGNYSGRQR